MLNYCDQDVTLTHVQDEGVILNGTMKLYFEDGSNTDQYVGSLGSGVTGIAAPTEVDITATTIDLNGDIDLTSQAPDVDLIDNNSSALSFDANGQVGILEVVTTNSSETVKMSKHLDVDGTSNLDEVDIDGAVQIDATLSVGVDDTGYDVKLFGATSGAYIEWDESDDELRTAGGAVIDIVKDKFLIGGTAVTTTAAELNLLDNVSGLVQADLTKLAAIDASATEVNILDASSRTTSTHDMEGNDYDFTVNAPEQSVTITLNINLTDNSDLSELTITNSSILATSVVMASSSAGPVTINEVTNGEFKCVIKNTTGSQINDNSTLVLNWVVI
jgi:hypothetical protein